MYTEKIQRNAFRLALIVLAVCVMLPLVSMRPFAVNTKIPDTDVTRVFGATRYDTAFDAANMLKERLGVAKFGTIIVACGTDFADALSGSYLANQKNAPILLVRNRNQEINQVKTYIKENLEASGTVYLLGGVNAVPKSMETDLNGFKIKRLAGATRYETSLAIVKEAGVGEKDILVCTGKNFADGLSASAVNMPVMLVKDSLSASQMSFLASLNGNKIVIIGGNVAVNNRIENALKVYGTTERIEGATRYYTSVNIAKKYFSNATCAVLAYADNFPDGLSGGPLAYSMNAPLILTMNGKQSVAVNYAKEKGISSGVVLGGTALISDQVSKAVFGTVKPTYTISYVLDGGQNNAQNPAQYTAGQSVALQNPYKEHYTFKGWYLDAACTQKIETIAATQTGNLTVYAKWEPEQYTITYELDGGTNATTNPNKYTYGTAVTFAEPEKEGYTFAGWYADAAFTQQIESIAETKSGNITLYAKWQAIVAYNITYELDGGRNAARNPDTYYAGETIMLQGASKSFNTFAGWYKDAAFTVKVTQIGPEDTGDLTLYAKWEPFSYTITYTLNNGTNNPNNPETYNYGTAINLATPTRTNHTFKGWYTDSAFKNPITEIPADHTGNIALYAKWNLSQLNILKKDMTTEAGMDNMIWSWWYYPQVVSTADTVYWGYATNEGYSGVAAMNIATGKVTTNHLKRLDKVDDHNGLSVTQLKDGRIMCVYAGGHDTNYEIHVRISEKANSIEKFSTDIVLTSAGKTCYGQVIQTNDRIYVFYRVNSKNWAYRSTANGVDWTEEIILVRADAQYYLKVVPTTQDGLLRVCMTSNPTATDPQIRMAFLDVKTGMMYNSNRTTQLGKKDVAAKNVDVLLTPPKGKIQRLFDVAITAPEQVRILYTVFSNSKTANDSEYYLYDSGKSVKICNGGVPLWNPKYQGGASFAGSDTVVLCRNENSRDFVEVYTYNGTAMQLSKSAYSQHTATAPGDFRNARPIVDVNGKYFLWHSGYYNPNSYTNFNTDAKIDTIN